MGSQYPHQFVWSARVWYPAAWLWKVSRVSPFPYLFGDMWMISGWENGLDCWPIERIFGRLASSSVLINDKDIPKVFKPLGCNKSCVLEAFRCNRHASLACSINGSYLRDFYKTRRRWTKTHSQTKVLRCTENQQTLFHHCTLINHTWAWTMCNCSDWDEHGPKLLPRHQFSSLKRTKRARFYLLLATNSSQRRKLDIAIL